MSSSPRCIFLHVQQLVTRVPHSCARTKTDTRRGIANTYGAFQTYYEASILHEESPSNISWIGSTQSFLLMFAGGFVTGPIFDAGYLRALVTVGAGTSVFGMMMTSISTKYWHFVLAQGITVGLGAGCLLLPAVAVMPAYFKTRRALATGIGASGSSLGTFYNSVCFCLLTFSPCRRDCLPNCLPLTG
jgi:hypothetical protein